MRWVSPVFIAAAVSLPVAISYAQMRDRAPEALPAAPAQAPVQAAPTAPAVAPASETAALGAALEAARARQLGQAQQLRGALTDPAARQLVDWALADVFGEQLGASEIRRVAAELEGWPREENRRRALERLAPPSLPGGPVPYTALGSTGSTSGGQAYTQRRIRMNEALRAGDPRAAYQAISAHGLAPGGADYAEAESFAGWLALTKLKDAPLAAHHFARLDAAVKSPVSKARAAYWRGRAAEALGDGAAAMAFFEAGAQHTTTFHGQLAAERAGRTVIALTPDPTPSAAQRAAFEADPRVRALELLARVGRRDLVRAFGLHLGEMVGSREELVLLVDKLKGLGEQEVSLLAYRRGAQQGHILHERGYPVIEPPAIAGGAEPALVLAIIRQESQFDPMVRSSANARGMMQILPGTGREVAQKVGLDWREELLWDPQHNMRLGSRYLGDLARRFSGSYVMAAAGYNAGPARPPQWIQHCGDPRASHVDPIDFIECIPFSETRTYVANVMANLQVYRARLNGGQAPLTLTSELRRGAWGFEAPQIAGGGSQATAGAP